MHVDSPKRLAGVATMSPHGRLANATAMRMMRGIAEADHSANQPKPSSHHLVSLIHYRRLVLLPASLCSRKTLIQAPFPLYDLAMLDCPHHGISQWLHRTAGGDCYSPPPLVPCFTCHLGHGAFVLTVVWQDAASVAEAHPDMVKVPRIARRWNLLQRPV